MPLTKTLEIRNEKGLHARASARFVEMVEKFDASAKVSRDGVSVSGNSIMGLMMLGAGVGSSIEVETSGRQEAELMQALSELVGGLFNEGR
jgi:phosphocarrier protein HPr